MSDLVKRFRIWRRWYEACGKGFISLEREPENIVDWACKAADEIERLEWLKVEHGRVISNMHDGYETVVEAAREVAERKDIERDIEATPPPNDSLEMPATSGATRKFTALRKALKELDDK